MPSFDWLSEIVFHERFIDAVAIIIGALFAWKYHDRRKAKLGNSPFFSRLTAADFATGLVLFPLFCLAVGMFSDKLLHNLVTYDRLTLAIASVFAIFVIIEIAHDATAPPNIGTP
jgi:hypothetical protein